MTRKSLEKFLGKTVRLTLFDGSTPRGILVEVDEQWQSKNKWYQISEQHNWFRCTHVKKCVELGESI